MARGTCSEAVSLLVSRRSPQFITYVLGFVPSWNKDLFLLLQEHTHLSPVESATPGLTLT